MSASSLHHHGGQVYALAGRMGIRPDQLLDFSSNANIFARQITERLIAETPYPFLHYPDTQATDLRAALAVHERVDAGRIMVGNGAAELIWQIMQGFKPQKVLFLGPIFSEYAAACEGLGIPYAVLTPSPENDFLCSAAELERLRSTSADLVVLCNPNNPAAVTYPDMTALLRILRAPRLLIDNSYREFLYPDAAYTQNHLNAYAAAAGSGVAVFTLNSFTKFFCCPGIRLGYLMGDRTHLARIERIRPSWTVGPYAQIMGIAFLDNIDAYRETLPALGQAIMHMGRELRRLPCFLPDFVQEGPGFLTCRLVSSLSSEQVFQTLLRQHILIRNCDDIPGMPPGYIRMQARPAEDADRLLDALDRLL